MKKYLLPTILAIGLFVNSCQRELDTFNDNPNSPTSITSPVTLLTGAQIGTINNSTGNLTRILTLLTQHTNGNNFQSLDITNYFITEIDNETDWSNIYQAGVNLNQIIKQFGAENPYYDGIARVLISLNMGYATDVWGDIPFTEAFQGANNLTPKYDTQQQVIAKIQNYLDIAITDFAKPKNANKSLPSKDDIFYNGDISKWTKLAYSIKARYALRLTQRDGSTVAANNALSYISKALSSNDDNLIATFDGGNNQNIWYAFNNQRATYMSMGKYFVDLLKNSNDPRLKSFIGLDAAGGYSGSAPEEANTDASVFGSFFAGQANTPNVIFNYSEIKFIEAEAQSRLGSTVLAQAALQEAISASITSITGTDNITYARTNSTDTSIQNIITQKYIALFTTFEPYNDWRRTGFPALVPNQNKTIQTKQIPLRLITPKSERTLNTNAKVVSSMYSPVWWDN